MSELTPRKHALEPRQNDMDAILVIDHLTKQFGKFTAVNNISLKVKHGEIFGFLGPNGAGKTTTIKMIAGLLQPDHGAITINNRSLAKEPQKCKLDTGYIPTWDLIPSSVIPPIT
jgi:ABC-2 type transport system ATP-binding protein